MKKLDVENILENGLLLMEASGNPSKQGSSLVTWLKIVTYISPHILVLLIKSMRSSPFLGVNPQLRTIFLNELYI